MFGFYKLDFIKFLIFLPIYYFFIRTIVTIIVNRFEDKSFPYRKQIVEKHAKLINKDPEDIKEQMYTDSFKGDEEIFKDAMSKFSNKRVANKK